MKSLFNNLNIMLFCVSIISGCVINPPRPPETGFTPEAMEIVKKILAENNADDYTVDVQRGDDNTGGLGSDPVGYILGVKIDGVLVLTNTVDSLRLKGIYRKQEGFSSFTVFDLPCMGISAKCDTLDSIRIITDSVIVVQHLGLGFSNLNHLPPEIGKIRTEYLDLSYNNLKELPLEVMQLLDPPQYYKYTSININGLPNLKYDSLPDTLKYWFENVYSNQNFN